LSVFQFAILNLHFAMRLHLFRLTVIFLMATIFPAADSQPAASVVPFRFDDIAAQAGRRLTQAQTDAAELIARAKRESDGIRRQAAQSGRQAAMQIAEKTVAARAAPAIDAVRRAAEELRCAKQAWVAHWESAAVHLAAAIAERIVRRELRRQPDIALTLVREALELAAGSPNVRLHLNPEDYQTLGVHVQTLIGAMSSLGEVEVAADAAITPGGCRVETRFGTIDQQIETQLQRIEEEFAG
jgi:flagellar assembly protein FliH